MVEFKTVCKVSDVPEGLGHTVYVGDFAVALFRIAGQIHAIDDTCPHMGASLGSGFVENGTVTCPWHFWRFRLADGKWADNPRLGIGCYPVRVVGNEIQVELPERPGGFDFDTCGEEIMIRIRMTLLAAGAALLLTWPAVSQPPRSSARMNSAPPASASKYAPRLVPIADTKLVMEGVTNANFLGLEKILKGGDIDDDAWTFARGQALLIAESGNLLMLRPPNNSSQDVWLKAAEEMRDLAAQLSKSVGRHDVERSRIALVELSQKCNACHESFRIKTRVKPFAAESR